VYSAEISAPLHKTANSEKNSLRILVFVTFGFLGPDLLQALGRVKKREGGLRDVPDPARLRHLNSLVQPEPIPELEQPSSAPAKTSEAKNVIPLNVS